MERLGDKLRLKSRFNAIKNLNLPLLKQKIEDEGLSSTASYIEIKFGDTEGLTDMLSLEPSKTNPLVQGFWRAWGALESLQVEAAGSSGLKFSWEGVKDCSEEAEEQFRKFLEPFAHVQQVGQKRQRV